MGRVLVIRHGTSTWNVEGRWQGWLDAPLAPEGEEQAAARGRELARAGIIPRAIYTSDLGRAQRTAEIIGAHLEAPVLPEAGFRERNGGAWQGLTRDEIEAGWPAERAAWRRGELSAPPGGEAPDAVLARFDEAFARAYEHVGRGILIIVTHHGILRLVATRAGLDDHTLIPNLGGFWFDIENAAPVAPEPVGPLLTDEDHSALE